MQDDLPGSTAIAPALEAGASQGAPRRDEIILIVLTLLVLLPFVNRAFNIDEPLFIWAAQQIARKPLDFYGFPVNWYATTMWMSDVMKNPPLTSYYIAAVGSLIGFSEPALRVAFLAPAVALVLGTYRLARAMTGRPTLAAALALLSPAMLISAVSVMCDVMMLAFWVWSIDLWLRGLREDRFTLLASGALLAALSALTKYFGISLIPLLLVTGIVAKRWPGLWIVALLILAALLAAYQIWTTHVYLRGLLSDAASYATDYRTRAGTKRIVSLTTAVIFLGGACIGLAPSLVASATRLGWIVFGVTSAAVIATVAIINPYGSAGFRTESGAFAAGYFVQLAALMAIGVAILLATVTEARHWRSSESVLLVLWMLGTFAFAGLFNWSVNARSILPAVPAAAIIVCRRMDRVRSLPARRWEWTWGLAPAAALSLLCTMSDAGMANNSRAAARQFAQRSARDGATLWVNGKWGFQYYMQLAGVRPIEKKNFMPARGDLIATAYNTSNRLTLPLPENGAEMLDEIKRVPFPFVTIMNMKARAGFYSDVFGPLPFVFGEAPPEEFDLVMLTSPEFRAPELRASELRGTEHSGLGLREPERSGR